MITNPNSAIQRIKNHLSYKLGQELIKYNTGGGGVISLLFKLYHIKKTHHKLTQFRKTLELARADLAYPPLRQCFDFNEALWVKTWLTYRLGRVLLECDRDKLKGGYFKFFSKIKQAKKEFKALKESRVYRLKDKLKFKNEEDFDLFIKNYALIENLLTHYEALNEVIVLNKAFVLEHFDEVSLWLNSKEFKDKYERENHPYPPLLDPDKLNDENYILNYEKISAEKAWEMNLPLPRVYKVVFFIFGASAHGTIWDFFTKSFDLSSIFVTGEWDQLYISNFYSIKQKDAAVFSKFFGRYDIQQDYKKIYLASHLPFLILVRDPISRLKTMVNHGGYRDVAMIENTTFHLNDNIDEVLDRRRFHNYSLYPNTEETMPYLIECAKNVNFSYTSIAEICKKQVYYMDVSEVNPNRV
ncbi:hypothetical protein, partial [Campylobacter helveticus]|uniref:hypothetical protein n=1 Tax=Campylobacter helveticus TaxID=28898 RepID=UPI0022EAB6AD